MKNSQALAVFFKIPELGRVKTRLSREIGDERALKIYKEMLYTTIEKVKLLNNVDTFGFYDGNYDDNDYGIRLMPQVGSDLGERLFNAFEYLFKNGYQKVCIIGADSPDLPYKYIYEAFSSLDNFDVALGPAIDGGYYLIGLKYLRPDFFRDIKWGSDEVFKQTERNINKLGLTYYALPQWYDIDNLLDLKKWRNQYEEFK